MRQEHNHICEKSKSFWEKEQWSTENRRSDNIKEAMKKYQLTEYMAHDRKYWMIKVMAGPAQGDGKNGEKGEKLIQINPTKRRSVIMRYSVQDPVSIEHTL